MCLGHFKFVESVATFGKFVDQVVFFNGHVFVLVGRVITTLSTF